MERFKYICKHEVRKYQIKERKLVTRSAEQLIGKDENSQTIPEVLIFPSRTEIIKSMLVNSKEENRKGATFK